MSDNNAHNFHERIEKSIFFMLCLVVVVASIGGMIEIIPLFKKEIAIKKVKAS